MAIADMRVVPPPLPAKGWFSLSAITQHRLDNFRRNRRGYWSFWILTLLIIASLFAELIANDRPIVASYKREILFPVLFDYPEDKFGGFLATTDYRDPIISDEINAHGWMIWPLIRFSYRTINLDAPKGDLSHPQGAPFKPTWLLSDADCLNAAKPNIKSCRDIEWNWLGTDDQGRDVVA